VVTQSAYEEAVAEENNIIDNDSSLLASKAATAVAKNSLDAANSDVENMKMLIGNLEDEIKENLTGQETEDE